MKIVHFIDSLRSGGKERQLVELIKGLLEHKVSCQVAIMSRNVHYNGLNELSVRPHYLIRKNKKDPRILLELYRLCKRVKPDIIHTWDSMTSVYAVPIASVLGIKLINGMIRDAPLHLSLLNKDSIRSKVTFPFSDVIVANSYAGLKAYRVKSGKEVCIHNGFDFERIKNLQNREVLRQKTGIATDKVVGMVASFSNKKDHRTFISAAERVLQEENDVTFLTLGDGENREYCKSLIKPTFRRQIKFLGKQSDVESFINIFDVGVLATYTEGISNSILEYMALGKPVVATNCYGNLESVVDGKTGFLTRPHDPEQMSKRIRQLLQNPELRERMGRAGRERIEKDFNFKKMTDAYFQVYRSLVT